MWPFGHFAVGYLTFAATRPVWTDGTPADWTTLAVLVVATQLPDLVDKPLSFYGFLPSGRSLGHSLLVFCVVIGALVAVRRGRPTDRDAALAVGYGTHLAGDAYGALAAGRVDAARYLLWPVTRPVVYPGDGTAPWTRLIGLQPTPSVRRQLLLAALAVGLLAVRRHRARRTSEPAGPR